MTQPEKRPSGFARYAEAPIVAVFFLPLLLWVASTLGFMAKVGSVVIVLALALIYLVAGFRATAQDPAGPRRFIRALLLFVVVRISWAYVISAF